MRRKGEKKEAQEQLVCLSWFKISCLTRLGWNQVCLIMVIRVQVYVTLLCINNTII